MIKSVPLFKRVTLAAVATAIAFVAVPGRASELENFNIPAGELASALKMVAKQTGLELIFQPSDLKGLKTHGVKGNLSPQAAVAKLIDGTELTITTDPAGAILIAPVHMSAVPTAGLRLARAESPAESEQKTSQSSATKSEEKIDEIVVTAQKREERLQEVPIAVSVLSGASLSKSSDRGVAAALDRVPGVSTQINSTSTRLGSSGGTVVVRGVPQAFGVSPTAYYLDGVPFGFVQPGGPAQAPDASGYDLERVEVLRGPQGSLYGASALNGVVRVLSKDADPNAFDATARGSVSNTKDGGLNTRADAMINLPIVEGKFAVRAVAGNQQLDGWIDKRFQKDANDVDVQNYRLKAAIAPNEKLSIEPMVTYYNAKTGAPSNGADGRTSVSTIAEPSSIEYTIYGLDAGYDFGGMSLSSSTSHIDYANHSIFDYEPFVNIPASNVSKFESEIFAEELRLDSQGEGPWRWSLGGFYRDAKDLQLYSRRDPVTGVLLLPAYRAENIGNWTSKSHAVFGELTRSFGPLALTLGLRYFEDELHTVQVSRRTCFTGIPTAANCDPASFTGPTPPPLVNVVDNYHKLTPRVVLAWHPSDDLSAYASYSQGFRSGFQQGFDTLSSFPNTPSVQPDELSNYEIGLKGSVFDRRVNFDGAVYYIDWKNVPVARSIDTFVLGTRFIVGQTDNGGTANGLGAELALTTDVTPDFVVGVSVAWNGLEIANDVSSFAPNGTPAILFSKGDRLLESAEYTAGFTGDYRFHLTGTLDATLSASANYISEVVLARTNITDIDLIARPWYVREAYWMARASVGVESGNHWGASLFVDNLTNEEVLSPDQFSPRWYSWVRPRTIGGQVEYKF